VDPSTNQVRRPPQELPRERLLTFGREELGEVELVALLLGGGRSRERAHRLLESVGGLVGLSRALPAELAEVDGVGVASATAVCAAFELARRVASASIPFGVAIRDPSDVIGHVRDLLGTATQEHFLVLGLDARQRVRMVRTVAVGSLSQVDVHPREVFRPLVRAGMHSAILVHNHPSGDPSPSDADISLTRRMAEAGRLMGIPVLDHLVVTTDDGVSLSALGLVPG
jgi:DNA repair protein RadC